MIAEFNSNPKKTFIACYGPTNCSDEILADDVYSELQEVNGNVPLHNFPIVSGDFDSQLGPEDAGFTFNRQTNRNIQKLVDICEELSLLVTNTTFMKPSKKFWTFQHPSGSRLQIDYNLVRSKWRTSVHNSQS